MKYHLFSSSAVCRGGRKAITGNFRVILYLLCVLLVPSFTARAELTLPDAELIALGSDPVVKADVARAEALQNDAVASGQLPDPKINFGLFNVPLDSFSLTENPTTQARLGITQAFPRGSSLEYKQRRIEWQSRAQTERSTDEQRKVQREVREKYLEVYFQVRAGDIIQSSQKLFRQLVKITQAQFASGRVSQQDVLNARLELSRLKDRETRIKTTEETTRATLEQWLGRAAWEVLDPRFPQLPAVPDEKMITKSLDQHPMLKMKAAQVEASNQAIQIAREQYKPGWNVGLQYRQRFGQEPDGTDRSNMMAAMVTFDLPLFTGQRQDKRLTASQQNASAAKLDRVDTMRKLKSSLQAEYTRWQRLAEREDLYRTNLLKESAANANAALNAYQSGTTEFTTLMRARLTELNVRLEELRIRVDRAKVQARLLYLASEDKK
ncbi:MAG: TolC family protein [Proteobacteria bacterium]|jgi:outer membrane protein TolC|nr:TolC family protein [Pseudomonadota bacterium]